MVCVFIIIKIIIDVWMKFKGSLESVIDYNRWENGGKLWEGEFFENSRLFFIFFYVFNVLFDVCKLDVNKCWCMNVW